MQCLGTYSVWARQRSTRSLLPTARLQVYVPNGSKDQQPSELQDSERCGQRLFEGSFPALQVRPAGCALRCCVVARRPALPLPLPPLLRIVAGGGGGGAQMGLGYGETCCAALCCAALCCTVL